MTLVLECNEFHNRDAEKCRIETNEFLKELAEFLKQNGYSVEEDDNWEHKVVIKFKAVEHETFIDTLRKFNE